MKLMVWICTLRRHLSIQSSDNAMTTFPLKGTIEIFSSQIINCQPRRLIKYTNVLFTTQQGEHFERSAESLYGR